MMTAPIRDIPAISVDFTDYPSMVEAFRAVKDHIAISNSELDTLCNFGAGQVDKLLGPTSTKGFGKLTLDAMLWALCIKATFTIDMDRVREMEAHWEQRCAANTRTTPNRISRKLVKAAKPLVLKEIGQLGGAVRANLLTSKHVARIAGKGGRARRRKLNKSRRVEIARKAGLASAAKRRAMLPVPLVDPLLAGQCTRCT